MSQQAIVGRLGVALDGHKESVDFAIDGAIYLLQKSGAVLKYYGRQSVQFDMTGLPDPFAKVAAIAVSGPDQFHGSVYVLDTGAGAIVELDKSGKFIRQYRGAHDEFANAQDLAFDPTSNTLYVATRDWLFSFAVQAPATGVRVTTPVGEKAPDVQPQP